MRPVHKGLKLRHSVIDIVCQVRVYVIIVCYGIRRTGVTFDNGGMLARNACLGIVCFRGMADYAGIPYVGGSKSFLSCAMSWRLASGGQCAMFFTSWCGYCRKERVNTWYMIILLFMVYKYKVVMR